MAERDPNARVMPEQVRDIISTTLTDNQVNAMINTAHRIVEQHLAPKNVDADLLEQIEMWLAAHFVCIREPRKESVKADEVSVKYQVGKAGSGLESTMYGQQALALDPTNSLASTALKRAVISAE